MGDLNLAGMARGSGRRGNMGLDRGEKVIGVDAANTETQSVGEAPLRVPVHPNVLHCLAEPPLQLIAALTHARRIHGEITPGNFTSLAEPDNLKDILSPRPAPPLLTSPLHQRMKGDPVPDIESADSLGRVELVSGDGQEIDPKIANIGGDFADGLCRVGVEDDSAPARDLRHCLDRLDSADFVVGMHERNENGVRANRSLCLVNTY
jgi:hypothetical protein